MPRPCKLSSCSYRHLVDLHVCKACKCCIAMCRVFDAGHKGQGLKAAENITAGSLVIEYVGEIMCFCSALWYVLRVPHSSSNNTKAVSTMALAYVQSDVSAPKAATEDSDFGTASHAVNFYGR